MIGVKALDFADWCQVAELIKNKAHLTSSLREGTKGLEEIKEINEGINLRRK